MLLWIDKPPKRDDEAEIKIFIEKYISCKIPDQQTDKKLHELVTTVQQHNHTKTCTKKKTTCRFNFPRFPSRQTIVAQAYSHDNEDETSVKQLKEVLKKCYDIISNKDIKLDSVAQMLEKAGVDITQYEKAIGYTSRGSQVRSKLQNEIPKNCKILDY